MRKADQFTIHNLAITSLDLMENAAAAFADAFLIDGGDTNRPVAVFCGKGNNGGDGLAIARLLIARGNYNVSVNVIDFSKKQSDDFTANLQRLKDENVDVVFVTRPDQISVHRKAIIIDAIFGSGLNKPLSGDFELLIANINKLKNKIYSVDVPSGFFADGEIPDHYNGIKAYRTICFQRPKINFFFPESASATKKFEAVAIGLNKKYIQGVSSSFFLTEKKDVKRILKPRKLFSHKGTYGHALIVAGNVNTMGAALLCASGCLYAGAGLTTACIPPSGLTALNVLLPEVMAIPRDEYTIIENQTKYQVVAVGPGLGNSTEHTQLLERLLALKTPMVLDADALNMLSEKKELIVTIPLNSVITPHVKEFDRLFGTHENWWTRVQTAMKKAKELSLTIVLKNQFTFVSMPNGKVYINPTGNPSMAQGGMGDVLTGIIASFMAQGYKAEHAAILGCYLHGRAGDYLSKKRFAVSASSVAKRLPKEVKNLIKK